MSSDSQNLINNNGGGTPKITPSSEMPPSSAPEGVEFDPFQTNHEISSQFPTVTATMTDNMTSNASIVAAGEHQQQNTSPVHSYRHSRAYRHFKNPPQPHMCIRVTTVAGEELFINVLSWTRIVIPQEPSDPIPLYGGMKVPPGSPRSPPLVYAVMANPEVLKDSGRHSKDPEEIRAMVELMCDFVEAMNPDVKLTRNAVILKDRDISGELKDVWNAVQAQRDREREEQMPHQQLQQQQQQQQQQLNLPQHHYAPPPQQMFLPQQQQQPPQLLQPFLGAEQQPPPSMHQQPQSFLEQSNAQQQPLRPSVATANSVANPISSTHPTDVVYVEFGPDSASNGNAKLQQGGQQQQQTTEQQKSMIESLPPHPVVTTTVNATAPGVAQSAINKISTDISNSLKDAELLSLKQQMPVATETGNEMETKAEPMDVTDSKIRGEFEQTTGKEDFVPKNSSKISATIKNPNNISNNLNNPEQSTSANTVTSTGKPTTSTIAPITTPQSVVAATTTTTITTTATPKKEKLGGFLPNGCHNIFPRFKNNKHKDKDKDKDKEKSSATHHNTKEKTLLNSFKKCSSNNATNNVSNSKQQKQENHLVNPTGVLDETSGKSHFEKNCLNNLDNELEKLDLNKFDAPSSNDVLIKLKIASSGAK